MKTQNQKNGISSGIIILMVLVALLIKTSAIAGLSARSYKATAIDTEEEILLNSLEDEEEFIIEDLELISVISTPEMQVIDHDDNVIFSGTEDEWNENNDEEIVTMKRKAELLFESDGTSIYKVF